MFLPPQPVAQEPQQMGFTPEGPGDEHEERDHDQITQGGTPGLAYGGEGQPKQQQQHPPGRRPKPPPKPRSNVGNLLGNHQNINFNRTAGGPDNEDEYSEDSTDRASNISKETRGGQGKTRGGGRGPGRGIVKPPNANRLAQSGGGGGLPGLPRPSDNDDIPPVPPVPTQYGGNPLPRPMGFDDVDQEYDENYRNGNTNEDNDNVDDLYAKPHGVDRMGTTGDDAYEDMYGQIETDRGYSVNNKGNKNKNNKQGESIKYQTYEYNTKGRNPSPITSGGSGLPKVGAVSNISLINKNKNNPNTPPGLLPNKPAIVASSSNSEYQTSAPTTPQSQGNQNPLLNNHNRSQIDENKNDDNHDASGPGMAPGDSGGPGGGMKKYNGQDLYKLVIMGDPNVGKTSLCITYQTRNFPSSGSQPNVAQSFIKENVAVGESHVSAEIWDTDGLQCYGKNPPEAYENASCVVICYSVVSRASFENIKAKWVAERDFYCGGTPIVLMGLKWDLTMDSKQNKSIIIKTEEGQKLADEIGAKAFVEGSASLGRVKPMFDEALRVAMADDDEEDKSGCCCVLL